MLNPGQDRIGAVILIGEIHPRLQANVDATRDDPKGDMWGHLLTIGEHNRAWLDGLNGPLARLVIAGKPRPREDCPWFWSDQYDLKLQIAGVSSGYDETVVRGAPDDRQFAVFYLKERRLIAVDAINAPAEFIVSKKLIMDKASPDPALLADATVPMKTIAERCSG